MARRLLKRYLREARLQPSVLENLSGALKDLLRVGSSGDPFILLHSMELLVGHLGASKATLVMVTDDLAETRWWSPELPDEEPPAPVAPLCAWLLANPERTLVAKDFREGAPYKDKPEFQALPYRAALGNALVLGGTVRALVFAFFEAPKDFTRADFALLDAVAGLMSRVLEIEDLKVSLNRMEDALAITRAVMEDSSIRDAETNLPNLRYLEIWQKAMLGSSQRPKSLVVAECLVAVQNRKDVARILKAAEGVRAGDLVVRVAPGRFQIIFQHTPRSLAHILLLRLRTQLGSAPMGATLWIPGPEGQGLDSCQPRLEAALAESRAMAQPALVWQLPEGYQEDLRPQQRSAPGPSTPQRWEPPTLQTPSGSFHIIKAGGKVESVGAANRPERSLKPANSEGE